VPAGRFVGISEQLRALAPVTVDLGVPQDGQQPGPRVPAIEGVQCSPGAQQGVLHDVFGVGGLARQGRCDPQQDRQLGQDQLGVPAPSLGVLAGLLGCGHGSRCSFAAWTYRHPSPLARKIKNHVAFWVSVHVAGTE